jgi:undecaprenyl-diphosphatase
MDGAVAPSGLRHPVVIAVTAAITLVVSWAAAVVRPVPAWERSLTSWFNDAPNWVAAGLYPVMQAGTLLAPLVAAVLVAVFRRDRRLALATFIAGTAAWFAAKAVKEVVRRGRPLAYLPTIDVRDGPGTGLGYVSGHSAVAAATALCLMAAVGPRCRPLLAIVVALVGIARLVVGVHFPADVLGGWALGALIGLAVLRCAATPGRRRRRSLDAGEH